MYRVTYSDGAGIPRVWGESSNEEQAEAEAGAALAEYHKGRPSEGPYTRVTTVRDDE